MDFDEERIYYSHQNLQQQKDGDLEDAGRDDLGHLDVDGEDNRVDSKTIRRHFKEFLRNYRQGPHRYLYRDRLLRMHRRTFGDEQSNLGNNENDDGEVIPAPTFSLGGVQLYPAIEVDLAHVGEYDTALLGLLLSRPSFALPIFEMAAADALKTFFFDARGAVRNDQDDALGLDNDNMRSQNDEQNPTSAAAADELSSYYSSIQILLKGNLKSTSLRAITASHMNKLLRIPGIVIQAARVQNRAARLRIRCSRCSHSTLIQQGNGPFSSIPLPGKCMGPNPDECGIKPYAVVPDECDFVDQQTLKLQESPESVPTGEMPRSIMLACERSLVDRAPPGTRISVTAIASLFQSQGSGGNKSVYLRVVGMQRENVGSSGSGGGNDAASFSKAEEEAFRLLAKRHDIYNILYKSIAPSISGSYTIDIKKAMVCQLFGGSRKKLPDKMRLRGDINVLLIGDPSTAKSQFLKFMQQVAPIAVYTSGKGSSAAGLTASVIRDARGEFYLEGGAMVLADGGIVCIDEFDKMRPADRVAIHEAMEQQTISIAKAGITTVLNSRSAVLAAANPVFGRYDDLKTAGENIDLMTTILSRFDLIFLVRDVREEERDRSICRHVMGVHMNSDQETFSFGGARSGGGEGGATGIIEDLNTTSDEFGIGASSSETIAENAMHAATSGGELDIPTMKKYVQYCKAKCAPRLSEQAGDVLSSAYVKIRDDVRKRAIELAGGSNDDAQAVIPITVRQLEALVRVSESLSKMRLEDEVHAEDVQEALRLFKISTMAANAAGNSASVTREGGNILSASMPSRDEMFRAEAFLRSRLIVGAMVNKQRIIEEASGQGYNGMIVARAIAVMCMRGEVLEKNQSRMIKRIK